MTDKVIENNQAAVMGKIISGFTFSHEIFGEGFYMMDVEVARLSESYDIIPVMVSERLIDVDANYEGEYVSIYGQFRSYNRHEERRNKLILSVFAREITFVDELEESARTNQIYLDGYICKERFTVRRPWVGRSRMCCWRSTDLTENRITFPAFVGAGMPDMQAALRLAPIVRYGDGSRAGNI